MPEERSAEDALRALAADLVEEVSVARALELAADRDGLQLAVFNVRPFRRTERSKTGRLIPEEVRGHTQSRLEHPGNLAQGMEHPGNLTGWIPPDDWKQGQQTYIARGEAAWAAHRFKDLDKVSGGIGQTRQAFSSSGDKDHPAAHIFRTQARFRKDTGAWEHPAQEHLGAAQESLDRDQPGEAYHHLHEAHSAVVEQALAAAQSPEEKKAVRAVLDRIQQHMEDIDKASGARPGFTRKLLGSPAEHAERGSAVRDDLRRGLEDAARRGDEAAVHAVHRDHAGVIPPDEIGKFAQAARESRQAREQGPPSQGRPAGVPHGAAAVHPALGHHARLPGGTLSGHEFTHVPRPHPVQAPSPEAQGLAQAHQRLAQHAQRDAQRRAQDLTDHLAELKAREQAARGIAPEGTYRPLTDEEYALHEKAVADAVHQALEQGLATSDQHSPDGGYTWEPDRASMHADILKEALDKTVDVPSGRQALIMGGLGGAGKSTTLKQIPEIDLKDFAVVNPDDFKEELARRGMVPALPGVSPLEASALIHDESSHLADMFAKELLRRGKNLAYDITMSSESGTARRLDLLDKHGYRAQGVFVDISTENSVRRAAARHREGLEKYRQGREPLGGRHVPPDIIRSQELAPGVTANRQAFEALKPRFTGWQLWDNNGAGPVLLDKTRPALPHGISTTEELRSFLDSQQGFTGATEAQARAAETGTLASGQIPGILNAEANNQ